MVQPDEDGATAVSEDDPHQVWHRFVQSAVQAHIAHAREWVLRGEDGQGWTVFTTNPETYIMSLGLQSSVAVAKMWRLIEEWDRVSGGVGSSS